MNLCYFELLGDAAGWNEEVKNYNAVTQKQISAVARKILREDNASVLYYLSNGKAKS
jgi:predicted Zn-dependent peptidase